MGGPPGQALGAGGSAARRRQQAGPTSRGSSRELLRGRESRGWSWGEGSEPGRPADAARCSTVPTDGAARHRPDSRRRTVRCREVRRGWRSCPRSARHRPPSARPAAGPPRSTRTASARWSPAPTARPLLDREHGLPPAPNSAPRRQARWHRGSTATGVRRPHRRSRLLERQLDARHWRTSAHWPATATEPSLPARSALPWGQTSGQPAMGARPWSQAAPGVKPGVLPGVAALSRAPRAPGQSAPASIPPLPCRRVSPAPVDEARPAPYDVPSPPQVGRPGWPDGRPVPGVPSAPGRWPSASVRLPPPPHGVARSRPGRAGSPGCRPGTTTPR